MGCRELDRPEFLRGCDLWEKGSWHHGSSTRGVAERAVAMVFELRAASGSFRSTFGNDAGAAAVRIWVLSGAEKIL